MLVNDRAHYELRHGLYSGLVYSLLLFLYANVSQDQLSSLNVMKNTNNKLSRSLIWPLSMLLLFILVDI